MSSFMSGVNIKRICLNFLLCFYIATLAAWVVPGISLGVYDRFWQWAGLRQKWDMFAEIGPTSYKASFVIVDANGDRKVYYPGSLGRANQGCCWSLRQFHYHKFTSFLLAGVPENQVVDEIGKYLASHSMATPVKVFFNLNRIEISAPEERDGILVPPEYNRIHVLTKRISLGSAP